MITDYLIKWFADLTHVLLGWLPAVPVPSWLGDADGLMGTVFGYAGSMGVWFPVPLAVTVTGAILAAWGIGFAVKAVRIVASFFTLGGGSAA